LRWNSLRRDLRVVLRSDREAAMLGWASPDIDGGRFVELAAAKGSDAKGDYLEFTLPSLKYWDMVVVKYGR